MQKLQSFNASFGLNSLNDLFWKGETKGLDVLSHLKEFILNIHSSINS